jgi:acyl-CoA synthetase (AMP-forming)/AMP-acid ligase II
VIESLPKLDIEATVPALLHAGVERFGEADYVVMDDRRLSFAEAERQSRLLAKQLVMAGVGKGTRVGLLLPTSPEFAVAFLACARIGAVAALFSTTYRPAELRRALRIADVQILLSRPNVAGRDFEAALEETVDGLGRVRARPYRLASMPFLRDVWMWGAGSRPWAGRVAESEADVEEVGDDLLAAIEGEVTPADHLLVIWTSGSSADPKGVVHTHGVAVRKVSPAVGLGLQASHPGVVFMASPFFWVGGPQSLLGCLFSGARLVCQERFEPASAIRLIERERCTTICGWLALIDVLQTHPEWKLRDTSSILPAPGRVVGPDGQTVLVPRTSTKGDPMNLGMTETFGPHANPGWFDFKVIDRETGEAVPDGDVGEFCVRGLGLMAAMYKREREEVLDADGYYHTGDRGYLEGGSIYFTGRYSEMIKAQGANVAPLEVETTLLSFPEIEQAFVFGVKHPERGEEVAAVLVAGPGCSIDPDDVRHRTGKLLSSYKVPTRYKVIDASEVPVLGSGKPDKGSMRSAMEAGV